MSKYMVNCNMPIIKTYIPSMQLELEHFFNSCFAEIGFKYDPLERHSDILSIADVYMQHGCMWCMFEEGKIIGTSALRTIAPGIAELKRMYVLPERQGRGYGRLLLQTVLRYCKDQGYEKVRLDTRKDLIAANSLYQRSGFKLIPKYNDNDFAELFYEFDLTKPVIRNAYIEDVPSIQKINSSAFGYEYGLEETKNRISCILKKPNDVIFVADADNYAVGYIHGSDYDCTYSPPLKNILTLGVLEEYRGRGIGRLLLERLEEWAREDGCAGVRLVSGFNRSDAYDFYLHCGYIDRKNQKNFIKLFFNNK